MLGRLQRGIEAIYRVETHLPVDAFLIDERGREETLGVECAREIAHGAAGNERRPPEQLLLSTHNDELAIGLFVDSDVIARLEAVDPLVALDDRNFAAFCLAVEGVSHFVYVALRAQAERQVSALELELQAEVDKFMCCVLVQPTMGATGDARTLVARLYERITFLPDLGAEERERYATANQRARQYATSLERRFLRAERTNDMISELRRFYRFTLDEKLSFIARAA